MGVRPHATSPGGKGALQVQFHRARTLIISAILVAATFLTTVATALAEGGAPPVPR
jgi:hypothetical protein